MWNKIIIVVFLSVTLVLGLFIYTFRNESSFSVIENRQLAKTAALNFENWFSTEYQTSVEEVLADHFVGRSTLVKLFNKVRFDLNKSTRILLNLSPKPTETTASETNATTSEGETTDPESTTSQSESNPTIQPTESNQVREDIFDSFEEVQIDPNSSVEVIQINNDVSQLTIGNDVRLVRGPIDFNADQIYVFDQNIQFLDDFSQLVAPSKVSAYFIDLPRLSPLVYPNSNIAGINPSLEKLKIDHTFFKVNSLSDIVNNYYRTDHHWNEIGSYKGYQDVIHFLLGPDEPILNPVEYVAFNQIAFEGSLSRMAAFSLPIKPDTIGELLYNLPPMSVKINGIEKADYGNLPVYLDGDASTEQGFDHYNYLYQKREGLIEFETGRSDRGNILIVSDSMSNPIRKQIASHFNKTAFIDMQKADEDDLDLDITELMQEGGYDQVLFMISYDNMFLGGEMKYVKDMT